MGFVVTSSEPYIFTNGTSIIILYVDNYIIISQTKDKANALFSELETKGYKLTDEGVIEEYLYIMITRNKDGSYSMSQPYPQLNPRHE